MYNCNKFFEMILSIYVKMHQISICILGGSEIKIYSREIASHTFKDLHKISLL